MSLHRLLTHLTANSLLTPVLLLLTAQVLVRKATAAENNGTTSISSLQHLDYINATSVWCSCGAELAASFASPEVTLIIIDVDWIVVTEQDYSPFLTPIVLKRNITVWGARENPARYPILDFQQYIKAKIALGRGVYLDFHRFVTERVREPANFQAPGADLIADDFARNLSDPSALGVVRYLSGITLHRTCFDNNASVTSIATLPRPRFIPGRQSGHIVDLPGPAPNCTASSAPFVPLAQRCLVGSSGVYDDTALYALSLDATAAVLHHDGPGLRGLARPGGLLLRHVPARLLRPRLQYLSRHPNPQHLRLRVVRRNVRTLCVPVV